MNTNYYSQLSIRLFCFGYVKHDRCNVRSPKIYSPYEHIVIFETLFQLIKVILLFKYLFHQRQCQGDTVPTLPYSAKFNRSRPKI